MENNDSINDFFTIHKFRVLMNICKNLVQIQMLFLDGLQRVFVKNNGLQHPDYNINNNGAYQLVDREIHFLKYGTY